MKVVDTAIPEVKVIELPVFGDHRGYFMETYSAKTFSEAGISNVFVQDNVSFTSQKGTLRGIHFQNNPCSQAKLVRVTRGAVIDVAVDLRKGSPTYKKWVSIELSAENKRIFYIPRGFGHGFKTLTDDVEFTYKVDAFYSRECDRTIRFDDPVLAIDWGEVDVARLSAKDRSAPLLEGSDCNFIYGNI